MHLDAVAGASELKNQGAGNPDRGRNAKGDEGGLERACVAPFAQEIRGDAIFRRETDAAISCAFQAKSNRRFSSSFRFRPVGASRDWFTQSGLPRKGGPPDGYVRTAGLLVRRGCEAMDEGVAMRLLQEGSMLNPDARAASSACDAAVEGLSPDLCISATPGTATSTSSRGLEEDHRTTPTSRTLSS